jgi:hypothetical protein
MILPQNIRIDTVFLIEIAMPAAAVEDIHMKIFSTASGCPRGGTITGHFQKSVICPAVARSS